MEASTGLYRRISRLLRNHAGGNRYSFHWLVYTSGGVGFVCVGWYYGWGSIPSLYATMCVFDNI